eukprot:1748646-Rhodomonas_salina.1
MTTCPCPGRLRNSGFNRPSLQHLAPQHVPGCPPALRVPSVSLMLTSQTRRKTNSENETTTLLLSPQNPLPRRALAEPLPGADGVRGLRGSAAPLQHALERCEALHVPGINTPQTQIQETAFSVQIVPGTRFLTTKRKINFIRGPELRREMAEVRECKRRMERERKGLRCKAEERGEGEAGGGIFNVRVRATDGEGRGEGEEGEEE